MPFGTRCRKADRIDHQDAWAPGIGERGGSFSYLISLLFSVTQFPDGEIPFRIDLEILSLGSSGVGLSVRLLETSSRPVLFVLAGEMSTPTSSTPVPINDPTALAKFGNLDFVARLVVEGYMIGQHKSPFKGASVEFVEHRQYYPGDEIRHIDWRAYGKTGKYYIKEFEEETNLRSYLLVDGSGSMGYRGATLSKFDYARQVAAALGYLLLSQRDAVGLMTFDTKVRERIDPATHPHTFRRITGALQNWQTGNETSLAEVFAATRPLLKRRSLLILLSDFFDDASKLAEAIKQFRHARHEVVMLQIVAPEEEDFPFSKPTLFHSLELETHRLLVDPHRLRSIYLEQYRAHNAELARIAGAAGADYQKIVTTEPYHKVLGAYLDSRTRRLGR